MESPQCSLSGHHNAGWLLQQRITCEADNVPNAEILIDPMHKAWLRLQLNAVIAIVTMIVTITSFVKKRRMSHENGVLARGTVRIVDEPTFPDNDFFTAGREFPCRIRHGSVLFKDDAKMTVRSAR